MNKVIIRNVKDNPSLRLSGVKIGDIGRITTWHDNLDTGFAFIDSIGKEMPVTGENLI